MLILNNDDLERVLNMNETMQAAEEAYLQLFRGEATCMPRCNLEMPTRDIGKTYMLSATSGGSGVTGYAAIRLQSDITYTQEHGGYRTREKYAVRPGLWCGLYLLFDAHTGQPLAMMNDGYLNHMRQGADGGIGTKYMARKDAQVVGMLGSGGMARTHALAFCLVRKIRRMTVFSPTREHREAYAKEMSETLDIDVVPVDNPRKVHEGVDILGICTDAAQPVVIGRWLEEGTHIVYCSGAMDQDAADRVAVSLRLGNTPPPRGEDWHDPSDTLAWATAPAGGTRSTNAVDVTRGGRIQGVIPPGMEILLQDLLAGKAKGRTDARQITYSDRGGMAGVENCAVAARAYELAKQQGLGREVPTDWFLQNIRD